MDFLANLIYWILFFSTWFLILKYRWKIKDFVGNFVWAESLLWRGSTYLIIILVWCLAIFIWTAFPFWVMDFLFKK